MGGCNILGCKSRTEKANNEVTFHSFPKDNAIKKVWINATGRQNWQPNRSSKICSIHFDDDAIRIINKFRRIKPEAVPVKHVHTPVVSLEPETISVNPSISLAVASTSQECLRDQNQPCTSEFATTPRRKRKQTITSPKNTRKRLRMKDSSLSENEIKVFCPKCDTEVSHTAEGIQEDQTKLLIAKVYHYFEREYEELKTIYGDLDLTPLSKFRQRTALATGVSETIVLQILKEEEGRHADKRQGPPEKRRARKRSRQTDSSSEEDSSDDNADDNEQSSNVHEAQTVVVKIEPPEYYNAEPEIYVPAAVKVEPSDIELNKEQAQTDPICLDVKTEPRSDVVDNTNETLALNEPAGTNRKGRKIPRSDVTPTWQQTRGDCSTAAAASSVRLTEELDESSLFGDTEIKVEEIEIHEGPS